MRETSVSDMELAGLTPRIIQSLDDAGILWEHQLNALSDQQLLSIPNIGQSSVDKIRRTQRILKARRRHVQQVVVGTPPTAVREMQQGVFSACQRCDLGQFCSIFTRRWQHLLHLCPRAREQQP